ncbi:MAG: hypothetical protein H6736_08320 [Alphaproteobacteria bacterium]|nr:hypothetical protein [Alphaproteobacteria bacterium]
MRARLAGWVAAVSTVVVLNLGCMGMVNELSGLDIQMAMEENAVHPADFPLGPPSSGKKAMSMGITADADNMNLPDGVKVDLPPGTKYRMEMVLYEHPDPSAELAASAAKLEGEGWTVLPQNENPEVKIYMKEGTFFILVEGNDGSEKTWSLIRLKPKPPEAPQ